MKRTFLLLVLQIGRVALFFQLGPASHSLHSQVANPPEPAIHSFGAQFPAVVQGDATVLRWHVSPGSMVTLSPYGGDVTDRTENGVGEIDLLVENSTLFTLIVSRDNLAVMAQTQVDVVEDVAPGWTLLDNFESHPAGTAPGNWANPNGSVSVVALDGNKALGLDGGDDLAGLDLGSLALSEGDSATLFFRVFIRREEPSKPVRVNIGVTDRSIGSGHHFDQDVGPFIHLEKTAALGYAEIAARDGLISPLIVSLGGAVDLDEVADFWLDIQKRSLIEGDVYSVSMKSAEGSQVRLFDTFRSDRNLVPVVGMAPPSADLSRLFVAAIGPDQGVNTFLLDDFYLSHGGFNGSTPVPASSFDPEQVPESGRFTNIRIQDEAIVLEWIGPGQLQSATEVDGPWTEVREALSPYSLEPSDIREFFRLFVK